MIKLLDILEKLDPVGQEDNDINNDGKTNKTDKYLLNRRKAIASNIKEGDHEVSMAQASLKAIAQASLELSQKIGNIERNIPGWIQDHIAKAENYVEQAAQGFHELKHDKEHLDEAVSIDIPENTSYEELAIAVANILKNDYGEHNFKPFIETLVAKLKQEEPIQENVKIRTEPNGFRSVEKIISSKDKDAVEQAIEQIKKEYNPAGYGTYLKKIYQTPNGFWVAVVQHSTTSD